LGKYIVKLILKIESKSVSQKRKVTKTCKTETTDRKFWKEVGTPKIVTKIFTTLMVLKYMFLGTLSLLQQRAVNC